MRWVVQAIDCCTKLCDHRQHCQGNRARKAFHKDCWAGDLRRDKFCRLRCSTAGHIACKIPIRWSARPSGKSSICRNIPKLLFRSVCPSKYQQFGTRRSSAPIFFLVSLAPTNFFLLHLAVLSRTHAISTSILHSYDSMIRSSTLLRSTSLAPDRSGLSGSPTCPIDHRRTLDRSTKTILNDRLLVHPFAQFLLCYVGNSYFSRSAKNKRTKFKLTNQLRPMKTRKLRVFARRFDELFEAYFFFLLASVSKNNLTKM